jgi:hypothetical protein
VIETHAFDQLYEALLAASRSAFSKIQQHPDEQLYAFGLYHSPLWGYIVPTCNTEAGLTRKAQHYRNSYEQYARRTVSEIRNQLRWNPCDWAYHLAGENHFGEVQAWLTEYDVTGFLLDRANPREWDQTHHEMITICRAVLRELDSEKLFEVTNPREKIVLNIMMGDQDGSWISHAKALNPPQVYAQWLR